MLHLNIENKLLVHVDKLTNAKEHTHYLCNLHNAEMSAHYTHYQC